MGVIVRSRTTTAPAPMSRAQQLFNDQNFTEFADYTGRANASPDPAIVTGDVRESSEKLINAGFNERNGSEIGSTSNNAIHLSPENAKSFEQVSPQFKSAHNVVTYAMNKAKLEGIKDEKSFRARFPKYMEEALGKEDADKINSNYMMPNLAKSSWNLYLERLSRHVPAEQKYTYDPVGDRLVPRGTASSTTTTVTPPASSAPKLRVGKNPMENNPKFVGPKQPD